MEAIGADHDPVIETSRRHVSVGTAHSGSHLHQGELFSLHPSYAMEPLFVQFALRGHSDLRGRGALGDTVGKVYMSMGMECRSDLAFLFSSAPLLAAFCTS